MFEAAYNGIRYLLSNEKAIKSEKPVLNFAALGTGAISNHAFVRPCSKNSSVRISLVVSSSLKNAEQFAKTHSIPHSLGSYEEFFTGEAVKAHGITAVYIGVRTKSHAKFIKKCLEMNLNVLCEKPITLSSEEALDVYNLALEKNLVLFEGYHYRFHPLMLSVAKILREEEDLGALRKIRVDCGNFAFSQWWNKGKETSSDDVLALWNVLCYAVDVSRFSIAAKGEKESEFDVTDVKLTNGSAQVKMKFGDVEADLTASKDDFSIMKFNLFLDFENATMKVTSFNAPFLYNRVETNYFTRGRFRKESFYDGVKSTFEFQLEEFLNCVATRTPASCDALNGMRNALVLERIKDIYNQENSSNQLLWEDEVEFT